MRAKVVHRQGVADETSGRKLGEHPDVIEQVMMTHFLVTALFLLTIVGSAFVLGIAAGYWAIRGFLNFFDPARTRNKPTRAPALAPTHSGD